MLRMGVCIDGFKMGSSGTAGRGAVSQHQSPQFNPDLGFEHCGVCILPVTVWVSSWWSGFLPHSKDVHSCRLIGLYIVPNVQGVDV